MVEMQRLNSIIEKYVWEQRVFYSCLTIIDELTPRVSDLFKEDGLFEEIHL